jgi:hypothetical protein
MYKNKARSEFSMVMCIKISMLLSWSVVCKVK